MQENTSLASRWAWELARIIIHPASFCAACYVAILGNGLAQCLGLSPGRQVEVDAFTTSALALGSSFLAALRGDHGEGGLWEKLLP
jgi:hypothetical protein